MLGVDLLVHRRKVQALPVDRLQTTPREAHAIATLEATTEAAAEASSTSALVGIDRHLSEATSRGSTTVAATTSTAEVAAAAAVATS
jgi:hypothetical protein